MAKTKVDEWDTVPENNADIDGISILGTAPASNMDNALRELMAQIRATPLREAAADMRIALGVDVLHLDQFKGSGDPDYSIAFDAAVTEQATALEPLILPGGEIDATGPISIENGYQITGAGYRQTTISVPASSDPFFDAPGGAGSAKHIGGGLKGFKIEGIGPASNSAQGIDVRGAVYTTYRNVEVWNFATGMKIEGTVGARFDNVFLSRALRALDLSGPSSLDQNTVVTFNGGKLDIAETLIRFAGANYHNVFRDTVFENFSKFAAPVTSGTDWLGGLTVDGGHVEGYGTGKISYSGDTLTVGTPSDSNIDLTGVIYPHFLRTRFGGSPTIYGATFPMLRDIIPVSSTGYPTVYFNVTGDAFELSINQASGVGNFTGQHGLLTTKPILGSVSAPIDRDYQAGTAESLLIGQAGGFFGFSEEGFQNLFTSPDTTGYSGAYIPYWPTKTATVTGGQTTCTGQADGVKIEDGYVNATGWASTVGEWYSIEVAWSAASVDDVFRVEIYSQGGGTLRKKMVFTMKDTGVHHRFIPFMADHTDTRFYIAHDGGAGSILIHRIQLHTGARARPFIDYRATVAGAFRVEGGIITDYGDTIPGAGVGKIGDMRMMRTPVAAGNRGWVKTSGGWKTFGAIAA